MREQEMEINDIVQGHTEGRGSSIQTREVLFQSGSAPLGHGLDKLDNKEKPNASNWMKTVAIIIIYMHWLFLLNYWKESGQLCVLVD